MATNYKFKLQKLVDEFDIDGGLQVSISKEWSLSSEAVLFEFLNDADAQEVFEMLELQGVQATIDGIKEGYETTNTSQEEDHSLSESHESTAVELGSSTGAVSFYTREAFDAEAGVLVERSPGEQARAHALFNRIKQVQAIQWALVVPFLEGRHHLDLGYSTREDFYRSEFGISSKSAERKLKAGKFLLNLLPPSAIEHVGSLEGNQSLSADALANFNKLAGMDITNIYDLSKVEDADYTELLSEGVANFPDGRKVALEDIISSTRHEIQSAFKTELDKYQARNSELLNRVSEQDALLKKAKDERDAIAEQITEAERKELVYGRKALDLEAYYKRIKLAEAAMREANKLLSKIELPEDAPEDLCRNLISLFRTVDGGRQGLYDANYSIIRAAKESRPVDFDQETGEILEETA